MVGTAHPFYFGNPKRPLFGWLHLPLARQSTGVGLVICKPLGYEAICAHRTNRHLASLAAARGIAALVFDYDGSGDSAGTDADGDRLNAWSDSIRAAIDTLRETTGVRTLYIAGTRLGSSLSILVAQGRPDVAGIIAINPVVEGRRYLRELRALAATSGVCPRNATADGQDLQAVAGFVSTADTRSALGTLRMAGDSIRVAPPRALLMYRTDLPVDDNLAQRLAELGCEVTREPFAGYADMLRDAHEAKVPVAALQRILDWICSTGNGAARKYQIPDVGSKAECSLHWQSGDIAGEIRERAVFIDGPAPMFGIVSEPVRPRASGMPGLLLLNSGAVHHIGPNRLYVTAARHFALLGFVVLRLDLPGLGDSAIGETSSESEVYPESPERLVAPAVRYLTQQSGVKSVHCAGICSGAFHGLKSAVARLGLASAIIINPLTYSWQPHMSLSAPAYHDIARIMRFRRVGSSAEALVKLRNGPVNSVKLVGALGRYAGRRLRHAGRAVARNAGIRLNDDLVADLQSAFDHGTRIRFVFASVDPGYPMLRERVGGHMARLLRSGAITIDFIEGADHTFTPYDSQVALLDTLHRILLEEETRLSTRQAIP